MIKILMLIIVFLFTSCFAGMPVMQSSVPPADKGRINISAGIGKVFTEGSEYTIIPNKSGKSSYYPVIYGNFQQRIDDVFSYEFFPVGGKLTEDLYKGNSLYISIFQSLYLLGFNYGILIAGLNQKINFYLSSRMDYMMTLKEFAEGSYGEGKYSANTSSIGINFKEKDFIVFMEFVAFFPIKTYSKGSYINEEGNSIIVTDSLYTERFYSFQIGVSF